jgi:hypothetical protein
LVTAHDLEDTAELQPQIVVQPRGGMLLEDEPQPFRRRNLAGPLGSPVLMKSRLASYSASFDLAKSSSIQSSSIQSERVRSGVRADHGACARTHTATRGLSAALGEIPQDAAFSLRNIAFFLVAPQ